MLYAGLKFTGLALRVATDLAKAVSTDAEKMVAQMESSSNDRVRSLSSQERTVAGTSSCGLSRRGPVRGHSAENSSDPLRLGSAAMPQILHRQWHLQLAGALPGLGQGRCGPLRCGKSLHVH